MCFCGKSSKKPCQKLLVAIFLFRVATRGYSHLTSRLAGQMLQRDYIYRAIRRHPGENVLLTKPFAIPIKTLNSQPYILFFVKLQADFDIKTLINRQPLRKFCIYLMKQE